MKLVDMWRSSPEIFAERQVSQVIGFAGEGKLRDGSACSEEFREFLLDAPSDLLRRYSEECLASSFDASGETLQDIVNEIGRRLGFTVTNGRYRGSVNQIGHDGLWRSPEGHTIIAESKTTDVYQVNLDVVAGYRAALVKAEETTEEETSILIVVGRQATDGLEAQVRGSRYAWDIRLISVDALGRLMMLKEGVEDPHILEKVRAVLVPREFTKLDGIIDLVFSAAQEIAEHDIEVDDEAEPVKRSTPVRFHEDCARRVEAHLQTRLPRRSRVTFSSADGSVVVTCPVSKEHTRDTARTYWFAFHPHQRLALEGASTAYVAFGCGSAETTLLIPFGEFSAWLPSLWQTHLGEQYYWHVRIRRDGDRLLLDRSAGHDRLDLTSYLLA